MKNDSGKISNGANIILLVHGPNLNALGSRDPRHYGKLTLRALVSLVSREARKQGMVIRALQSNHEGALIDFIQKNAKRAAGIIVNPGALTHYSYALHDALVDTGLPAIEVHLSDIRKREAWRRKSVIAPACARSISGKKEKGYVEALATLARLIRK
ncbi:MAG: type II 3-dehydroquinate dehydratase [Patescibacteria group bacterium]